MPALETRGVSIAFGGVVALDRVDLAVAEGVIAIPYAAIERSHLVEE